jgi:hypothetical protein
MTIRFVGFVPAIRQYSQSPDERRNRKVGLVECCKFPVIRLSVNLARNFCRINKPSSPSFWH